MAHAVLARYPSNRYSVSSDTKHFFFILKVLPESVVDFLLGWPKPYGLKYKEFHNTKVSSNGELKTSGLDDKGDTLNGDIGTTHNGHVPNIPNGVAH
mgnify:FL=1